MWNDPRELGASGRAVYGDIGYEPSGLLSR